MSDYTLRVVKLDPKAMDTLLRSKVGPVGRHLGLLGLRMVVMAKRLTGTDTGELSKSIQMTQVRSVGGQEIRVFSNKKYAYLVHEGTRPHLIDPPGAREMTFLIGGRRVFARQVHHPGTRGKYFLTIPLRRVIH